MQPAIAMPLHDPDGLMYPHLQAITPQLRALFDRAYLSIPHATRHAYEHRAADDEGGAAWLTDDPFYSLYWVEDGLQVGDQFLGLYRTAAASCPPEQTLHLAFPDRVAFALENGFAESFAADMRATRDLDAPLIFQRSPTAWETHPRNYYEIENFVTRVGAYLYGRELDFAWCHLALPAGRLAAILPEIRGHDISMVAEMVMHLKDDIQTRDVDWLAWEDPFILETDAAHLKAAREQSRQEVRKRLAYAIPMVQRLIDKA